VRALTQLGNLKFINKKVK